MRYGSDYGFCELNPFPGCNQIVVSNHSLVRKEFRGKGVGTKEHQNRLKVITHLGYDYALCTCKETNIPQIKILLNNGWKQLDSFKNQETENTVLIFGRQM